MKKSFNISVIATSILLLVVCTTCVMGTSDNVENTISETVDDIQAEATNDISDDVNQTEIANDDGIIDIRIDYTTDELLSQYESFHEYNHVDEALWVVIRTDKPINDFEYIKVGHDFVEDEIVFYLDYVEYTVGELTPDKPFKLKTYGHWGTIPHYGVSFTDADNVKRFFYIVESGYDGSLSLVAFHNTPSLQEN